MLVDGKKVPPSNEYAFEDKANHSVSLLMDLTNCTSLSEFFSETDLLSIKFSSLFDTKSITNMNKFFYNCYYLTSVDFSGINTTNLTTMSNML